MAIRSASVGFSFTAIVAIVTFSQTSAAYYAPPRDRHAIRSMAGCYESNNHFAETIPLQEGYQPRAPYHESSLEWIVVDRDNGNRLTLQHILMTPQGPRKSLRQEWELSADSILEYKGDSHWSKRPLSSEEKEGRWVQRVYLEDDSPRNECSAPWVHWGGHVYWECQSWSPLPQRELTRRSDYNVLDRRNRYFIRSDEWIHEEDNVKLRVEKGSQKRIVKERGENTYQRVGDERCLSAKQWWDRNKNTWHAIQKAWKEVYASNDELRFKTNSSGESQLRRNLFELGERAERSELSDDVIQREALALIEAELIQE